jgi:hypothetical protein
MVTPCVLVAKFEFRKRVPLLLAVNSYAGFLALDESGENLPGCRGIMKKAGQIQYEKGVSGGTTNQASLKFCPVISPGASSLTQ